MHKSDQSQATILRHQLWAESVTAETVAGSVTHAQLPIFFKDAGHCIQASSVLRKNESEDCGRAHMHTTQGHTQPYISNFATRAGLDLCAFCFCICFLCENTCCSAAECWPPTWPNVSP